MPPPSPLTITLPPGGVWIPEFAPAELHNVFASAFGHQVTLKQKEMRRRWLTHLRIAL